MNRNKFFLAGILFIFISITTLITSCIKDTGKVPKAASACDTITYTKHIKPIIDQNCALPGCHAGTTSNPFFTDYGLVKGKAERIKARAVDANPTIMPPSSNTPLTNDQKQLITCWLEGGTKE